RGDGHGGRRGVVAHGDADRRRARPVAGGIAGVGGQGVVAVGGAGRVPGHLVGRGGVLRSQRRPVQLELDAGHGHVVGGGRGDGHGGGDDRPRGGSGEGHRG